MIDNQEYDVLSNRFIEMSGMKIRGVLADLAVYKDFILNMQE